MVGFGFWCFLSMVVWSNKQHGYPATWYGSRSSWIFVAWMFFFSCLPSFQIQVVIVAWKNTSNSGLAKGMKLADVILRPEAWSETGNQAGKSGASRVAEISRIFKSLEKIAMMLCFHWNLEIFVGSELTRYWLGWTVPGKPQVWNISVHRLQLKGRRRRMRRRWRGAGQNRRDFRDSKLKDIWRRFYVVRCPGEDCY